MSERDDIQQAKRILEAVRSARRDLATTGAGAARAHFSALRDGLLSPHVRDVYDAQSAKATRLGLDTLEELARAFVEDENKLRPDVNETAFRVMLEATGQSEKTVPPSERTDEQKSPEAVERGRKGGEKSST